MGGGASAGQIPVSGSTSSTASQPTVAPTPGASMFSSAHQTSPSTPTSFTGYTPAPTYAAPNPVTNPIRPSLPTQAPAAAASTAPGPSSASPIPTGVQNAYTNSSDALAYLGSQAMPAAAASDQYMQNMFSSSLNPLETQAMQAGANLGQLQLNSALQQVDSQFQGAPFSSGLANAADSAATQFADQQVQTGAQTALQRELGSVWLPNAAQGAATNPATAIPNLASNLFNQTEQAQYSGATLPLQYYSQMPIPTPVVTQGSVVASPSSGGKL